MKVLVLQDSLTPRGGAEIAVTQTVKALAEAGCTPVVVCQERGPNATGDVTVYEIPELFRRPQASSIREFQAVIDRERPDLVHIHNVPAARVIRLAAERLPTIVTIHVHNVYCPGGAKVFWRTGAACTRPLGVPCLLHAYAHRCAPRHPVRLLRQFTFSREAMKGLKLARQVLTLSDYVRERLLQSGLGSDRVTVLAPWVEMPPPTAAKPGESVLFAGRLTREKGLATMLSALALVQAPLEAVIAGDGPLRQPCERLAAQLSLDQFVRFRGWLSAAELRDEYARSAFLVVPSLWPEPFGMVGPEAMAYGKPVVAFDVGGVREWLVHGVNGFLVPKGDTAGLATAITELLTNAALRAQLGAAARDHVEQRFSRKLHVSRLMAAYSALLT